MSSTILSRTEVEAMGPPFCEEIADTGVSEGFLCDLALKHVAMIPEPTTTSVAERLHLPRTLTEEILQKLYRPEVKRSFVGVFHCCGARLRCLLEPRRGREVLSEAEIRFPVHREW